MVANMYDIALYPKGDYFSRCVVFLLVRAGCIYEAAIEHMFIQDLLLKAAGSLP